MAHCFGEAIPICFVILWAAAQLWSIKQHRRYKHSDFRVHTSVTPVTAAKALGRWKICLWGEIGQASESKNRETDAVFLPQQTGTLLKYTLSNWRHSSLRAIPRTLWKTTLPTRLESVARSLTIQASDEVQAKHTVVRSKKWRAHHKHFVWDTPPRVCDYYKRVIFCG